MPISEHPPYTTRWSCLCHMRQCEFSRPSGKVWTVSRWIILVVWHLVKKFRFSHMQQSTACLHFAWCTTSLRVGGRVARHSWLPGLCRGGGRQAGATVLSCLVWRCELTAGQVHSASECHLAVACTLNTECTCLAVGPTQFTPPHQTRQNSPVCVVSGVAVWIGQLLLTCSDFKFSVGGDSLELSGIQFTPPKQTSHRQDSFIVSGVAV